MSNCRCEDIRTCKDKIEKLEYIINALQAMNAQITNLNDKVNSLSEKAALSYEGINTSELKGAIMNLDNDIYVVKNDFQAMISNKVQQLKTELHCMEDEDKEYHEEEKLAACILQEGE